MEAALAGFDVAERAAVVPYLVPRLAAWLDLPDASRSGDARDALYALREQAPTEDARKTVDAVLMPALVKDVKAGPRAGRAPPDQDHPHQRRRSHHPPADPAAGRSRRCRSPPRSR